MWSGVAFKFDTEEEDIIKTNHLVDQTGNYVTDGDDEISPHLEK